MADGGGLDVFALALKLTADGAEQAESALDRIDAKGSALEGKFAGVAGVLAGAIAAFVALDKASEFLKGSVDAAAAQEDMYVRMGVAVSNAGQNFTTAKPAIDALLESLSANSTYRVDQLGAAFTRLVQLTGNVGTSMDAMAVVTNFAAARNLDLESAANLVGRAMNGNAIMLNRMLGLHGSASAAIATLTERYKDNAAALADTMGGAQAQAQNAMHEFMETLGDIIANEGGLKEGTLSWRDAIKDATTWVKQHREEIGNVVLGFISLGEAIASIVAAVKYPLVGAWIAANAIMYTVIATVESLWPTFKLAAANIAIEAVNLISTLANVVPGLHALLDGVMKKVVTSAMGMAKDAQAAIDANTDALNANLDALLAGDEPLEQHTAKVVKHTTAVAADVTALIAEGEELAKLAAMRVLSGSQFEQEEALYAQLTKLVESHTLKLEDEVKVRETLAKMQAATPLLAGPQVSTTSGPTVDQAMADLNAKITAGLIAGEKNDAAAMKSRAQSFVASAEGQWAMAHDQIMQHIQDDVTTDFATVGVNLADTISDTLGAAFSGGFANAGKVALQGLGNILSTMGKHMIVAGAALVGLLPALHNPFTSGAAMLAAGAILVAAGAVLGSIATGGGGGGGGSSGGYAVAGAGTATNAAQITNITLAQTSATQASKNAPLTMPPPITIIGSNDPTIHQPLIDIINDATGRGYALKG